MTFCSFKRLMRDDERGIAAIEFALIAPVMLAMFGLLVDFALAFNTQLRLASSLHVAAQVAFQQGQSVDANSAASLITTVSGFATRAAGSMPVNVSVLVNNAADGSNANRYYCVTAGSTPSWSSTGTSSASCGGSLTSGKFVSISMTATRSFIFLPTTVAARIATMSDTAIVRVQ